MSYVLPPEWAPQSAVMLTWPHKKTDWQPFLSEITQVYIKLAHAITQYQTLVIAMHDNALQENVLNLLSEHQINLERVKTFISPCNDTWARDHGPITLTNENGDTKFLDFTFNAWGAKFEANLDNDINGFLLSQPFCQPTESVQYDLILEGGSIESDGNGTLLTTSTCLLNPNRNHHLSKQEIEQQLLEYLGMDRVLWLEHGYLAGDDTDAHIDTLARFAPEGIVYVQCNDKNDPHFDALNKMEQQLQRFADINGKAYKLFPLPMPSPVKDEDDELLPATYANYLIINGAVLVPIYNDEQDQKALEVIKAAHPNRDIIGVDCRAVIKQYGSLHCLTMQIPANVIV